MRMFILLITFAICGVGLGEGERREGGGPGYLWQDKASAQGNSVEGRFAPPAGYRPVPAEQGTFADWLRHLPLKQGRPPVLLFDGLPKDEQDVHVAVIDMPIGNRDLQQCADSVIRLRGEYLWAMGALDQIHFRFTSGHTAMWLDYAAGKRPVVKGNQVEWKRSADADRSYANFGRYLDLVYTYAGTRSLDAELHAVADPAEIQIGDVFVQGGSPGHAVIVVNVAADASGRRVFLLAQGYMPAQEMHVLKNPANATLSPWYECGSEGKLKTPEWVFEWRHLKRF